MIGRGENGGVSCDLSVWADGGLAIKEICVVVGWFILWQADGSNYGAVFTDTLFMVHLMIHHNNISDTS